MTVLLDLVAKYGISALFLVLLIFGFAPVFSLRLIVLLYPAGDPRRVELVAELYVQGRFERLFWVSEQIATAFIEGPKERYKVRKKEKYVANTRLGASVHGLSTGRLIVIQRTGLKSERRGIAKFKKALRYEGAKFVTVTSKNGSSDVLPPGTVTMLASSRCREFVLFENGRCSPKL